MLIPTLAIVGFMTFTAYAWLRLDSLLDRAAVRTGRARRALLRQAVAIVGWWLIVTGFTFKGFGFEGHTAVPLVLGGFLLVGLATCYRERGDVPIFERSS